MDFTKDIDVIIANGELIADVVETRECLQSIQNRFLATGTGNHETDRLIADALHDVGSLYRRLIDLQIQLLTLA